MKNKVFHKLKNKDGSTLLLMIMVIAAVIMLGTTLLSITMSQYQIRKSNSDVKRAFYLSETGLNESYLRAYELIQDGSADALSKAEEYLIINPEEIEEVKNIFKNNYKQYVIKNAKIYINSSSNPTLTLVNADSLLFKNDKLNMRISSKYISTKGIEKTIAADVIVSIPDFIEASTGGIEFFTLLDMINFDL